MAAATPWLSRSRYSAEHQGAAGGRGGSEGSEPCVDPTDQVDRDAEACVSEISLSTIDNEAFTKAMRTEFRLAFTKGLQGKMLKIGSMEVG